MKATYSKNPHRFTALLIAIAAVCCVVTHIGYTRGVSSVLAGGLGVVLTPLRHLGGSIEHFVEDRTSYFGSVKALREENEALREQNEALTRQVSSLEPYARENKMLAGFLELKREVTDIKFVDARITARSSSAYTSDFTLDKGSDYGLKKDMAVLSEDKSILGILVEVGPNYARGKTLTSYDLSLGVRNERTGQTGIVSGGFVYSRDGRCRVGNLRQDSDFKAGDIIRTSGLGGIYPAGLYVGTVEVFEPDAYDGTFNAVVVPSETIFTTDRVMIVTDYDRSYEPVTPEHSAEAPLE